MLIAPRKDTVNLLTFVSIVLSLDIFVLELINFPITIHPMSLVESKLFLSITYKLAVRKADLSTRT